MAQLFRPGADTVARVVLCGLVLAPIAAVALAYAVRAAPYNTGQSITVEQPIPFSHKHHVGEVGLDCRYCHTSVESSRYAGVPSTAVCMTCHSQLWTNAPMLAPVRDSFAQHVPIHWKRVNRLPDYVYFDHAIHVAKGVGCSSCHGPVHEMALMRQAQPLTMKWCLDCHRDPGPRLRPESEIYNTAWRPDRSAGPNRWFSDVRGPDRAAETRAYLGHYKIKTAHLTDCSVCHR